MPERPFSTYKSETENHAFGANVLRLESASDEELVAACRVGHRAAFDALLKRYERKISNMAFRLCGDAVDAQDIVANAYVRIYHGLPGFRRSVTLGAWIRRIVLNAYYDWQRQTHCRKRFTLFADLTDSIWEDFFDEAATDASPSHSELEKKERQRIIGQAIESLPDHHRKMMILYHVEDRSYLEIAKDMDLPVGTVKSRLNRARVAVRRRLSPFADLFDGSS